MEMPTATNPVVLHQGDCLDVLRALPDGCVDAVVTDPPYGLEFMGKEWDSFRGDGWRAGAGFSKPGIGDRPTAWPSFGSGDSANATCETCGGRMRGANKCGCDEPNWRVKGKPLEDRNGKAEQGRAFQAWCAEWATAALRVLKPGGYMLAFGGTRTYHRLTCAVEDAGFEVRDCLMWLYGTGFPKGQGCLKPAVEPILLCRRPGPRVLPLGIDECRIGTTVETWPSSRSFRPGISSGYTDGIEKGPTQATGDAPAGRWPANVVLSDDAEVLEAFAAFGERGGSAAGDATLKRNGHIYAQDEYTQTEMSRSTVEHRDAGSAARFFYTAKASQEERTAAPDGTKHPTQKPLELMRWLVRLVTPRDGVALDPFAGSGTTGVAAMIEGRRAILVEREPAYCDIIRRRLADASGTGPGSLFQGADLEGE